MRALVVLSVLLFCGMPILAQVNAGAAVGWSHSRTHGQGGPLISLSAERTWKDGATRAVFEAQLLSAVISTINDDGSGRKLAAGGWSDGHFRSIRANDQMSMVGVGIDHLFAINGKRHNDGFALRLGPGVAYTAEQLRYDYRIEDQTAGTTTFHRYDRSRRSGGLRATIGVVHHLPFGILLVEACTDLLTLESRDPGAVGSAWFQRQTYRIGAVFPIEGH